MRGRGRAIAAALLALHLPGSLAVRAQQTTAPAPAGAGVVASMSTRADSMAELARLDAEVRTHPNDAAAWHARGLLAWQLSQGGRALGKTMNAAQLRLSQAADSSLVAAITLAPTAVRYLVDFATYRAQGSPFVRAGATRYFSRAFDAARAAGDSLAVAQMADALGMVDFRSYQMFFQRRMYLNVAPGAGIADILNQQSGPDGRSVSASADLVRHLIEERTVPVGGDPPPGSEAYDRALDYFETANVAMPSLPLPWRHRFAALADRRRWEELEVAARRRVSLAPWDPEGWLALGLARHREGATTALAAFDSAFALMTDSTRARLDRVERIMRPKAARTLDAMPPSERARTTRFVWAAADPLWSVPGNEVRAEYLARVAFAELRFTDEELRVRGVDTYPGDLHVRYGFPKVSMNYECGGSTGVCWLWWFAPGLQFVVRYQAIFNRSLPVFDDIAINEDIQVQAPAAWNSIPGLPSIDSIPLRVARFRPDGVRPSVFVSGTVPLKTMAVGGVRGAGTTARLWMIADGADAVARDSARTDASGLALWKLRAPVGDLFARAEVVAAGGGAARGTALAPGVATGTALELSDLIIATTAADGDAPATRWHELVIAPAPDTLPRARSIAIAWETYGLAARDGTQRYTVRLVLEKASKSLAGRIVAQLGGLAGIQRGDERVTLSFDRDGAARDVTLDHVALSLREAPAGRYKLTVEIIDKVTGAKASRGTPILIGP